MLKLKGKYGELYELEDGQENIKITKKDGKVFFISLQDIGNIVNLYNINMQLLALNEQKKLLENN